MDETQDTIDGLLAEMREHAASVLTSGYVTMSGRDFHKMLDRFEAAHKRKKATAEKSSAAGDAAKLREALKATLDLFWDIHNANRSPQSNQAYAVIRQIKAALAAPPRNCDVYNNESCRMAYHLHGDGLMTMQAFADWLFAPATKKEGGAK